MCCCIDFGEPASRAAAALVTQGWQALGRKARQAFGLREPAANESAADGVNLSATSDSPPAHEAPDTATLESQS